MPEQLIVATLLVISSILTGGSLSSATGSHDESFGGIVAPMGAENCQFCVSFTGSDGITREACDTKAPCASNQVCTGEGGVDAQGNPWAKAICRNKNVSDVDTPIQL